MNELDPSLFSSATASFCQQEQQRADTKSTDQGENVPNSPSIETSSCNHTPTSKTTDQNVTAPSTVVSESNCESQKSDSRSLFCNTNSESDKVPPRTAKLATNSNKSSINEAQIDKSHKDLQHEPVKTSPISQLISFSQMSRKWFDSMSSSNPNPQKMSHGKPSTERTQIDESSGQYYPCMSAGFAPNSMESQIVNASRFNPTTTTAVGVGQPTGNPPFEAFNPTCNTSIVIDDASPMMLNYFNCPAANNNELINQTYSPVYNLSTCWNSPSGYDSGFESGASFHGNSPRSAALSSPCNSIPPSPNCNDVINMASSECVTSMNMVTSPGSVTSAVGNQTTKNSRTAAQNGKDSEGILTSLGTKELEMRMFQDYLMSHNAFKRGPRKNDPAMEKRRTHKCTYEG